MSRRDYLFSFFTIATIITSIGVLISPQAEASEGVTVRPVPVAQSGVSGEITLTPMQGSWESGMWLSVKIKGVKTIRERAVIVSTFSEPNCPFEARSGHFWTPDDPLIERGAHFMPGFWERDGMNTIETDFPIGYKGRATRWRGSDKKPITDQVKSVGIFGYSRTVPTFMGTVLACANLSDEPVNVGKVSTTADEPASGGSLKEDTTPFRIEFGTQDEGMRVEMRLRPYRYNQDQTTWYRSYAETRLHGTAELEDSAILMLFSQQNCVWKSRQCVFFEQWKMIRLPPEGEEMTLNCLVSPGFNTPPGYKSKAGGWLADRKKMNSVGLYNYKVKKLIACGNIPPPIR